MAKGAYKKDGVYTCTKCGNILKILEAGGGNIVCCLKAIKEDLKLAKKYQNATPPAAEPAPEPEVSGEADFEAIEDLDLDVDDIDLNMDSGGADSDDDFNIDDFDIDIDEEDDASSGTSASSASAASVLKALETIVGSRELSDEELSLIQQEELFSLASYDDKKPVEKQIGQIGNVQITLACFNEHQMLDIHSHPDHNETVFLLDGRGFVYLGERSTRTEIMSGAFFTIPKNIPHGFKNTQTSEMLLLWFHHQ